MIHIIRTDSSNAVFKSLAKELDEDLFDTYKDLQKTYDSLNVIPLNANVVVCYDDERPIGCGCIKEISTEVVEIKRIFIRKDERGKGTSKIIMKELLEWAIELKKEEMILETGKKQIEAISLYEQLGFKVIDNYGEYLGNKNSICMKLELKR